MLEPSLDLYLVETHQLDILSIADISQYPQSFTITNATLEITPPAYNKIVVNFMHSSVNSYRPNDLGIDCGNNCTVLPDGIYNLKYSIQPNNEYFIEKSFIRVTKIRQDFLNAFLRIDFDSNLLKSEYLKIKEELQNIDLFINGAVAASANCDIDGAYKLYKKAERMLRPILQGCCN